MLHVSLFVAHRTPNWHNITYSKGASFALSVGSHDETRHQGMFVVMAYGRTIISGCEP